MFRHADVVCLCLVCILWQFSCCVLHDLQFVKDDNHLIGPGDFFNFRFDSALVNSSYDNGEFITVDTSSDSVIFFCSVRAYFCLCSSTGILLASL